MIENILDICAIINSDLRFGSPVDEDDIVTSLVKNKMISKDTAETIKQLKGFRNIIVHRYGTIDDKLAFELISNNLEDFDKIIGCIKKIIEKY